MNGEELKPGDLCVVVLGTATAWERRFNGLHVVLIAKANCPGNHGSWGDFCPHWMVSGMPPQHWPSHKVLRKIPPAPIQLETEQEETLNV